MHRRNMVVYFLMDAIMNEYLENIDQMKTTHSRIFELANEYPKLGCFVTISIQLMEITDTSKRYLTLQNVSLVLLNA